MYDNENINVFFSCTVLFVWHLFLNPLKNSSLATGKVLGTQRRTRDFQEKDCIIQFEKTRKKDW